MAKYENICKYIHLPVQSGSYKNIAVDEQNLYTGMVYGESGQIREIIPGLRNQLRYHCRLLYRNGRRSSGYIEHDGILQDMI